MAEEYEETEVYLYMDFKGRLPANTFNSEIYFNIANLNTKHPLVQLGHSVFYGKKKPTFYGAQLLDMIATACLFVGNYEDCVGTNVFFEEDEQAVRKVDAFSKQTPISLKYVAKQFKILDMQWAKVPEDNNNDREVTDDYDIKFKEDYEKMLKKIEGGK